MKINFVTVVTIVVLGLALVPCVPARSQPTLSIDSNLVNINRQNKTAPTPLGTRNFLNVLNSRPSVPGVERRSLKSSSSDSKSKQSQPKTSKLKWKGRGSPTLLGSVIGVSVFLVVFALCVVFITVTEKREEDPNWKLRTFLRRRLNRKNKAGKGDDIDMDDMEKPHVEKKASEARDLDADPVKKIEPADVN